MHVSTFALGSLPYLATIVVLVVISADQQVIRRHAPASLGLPFHDGDDFHPPANVASIPAQNGTAETNPDLSGVILRSNTRYPGSQLTNTPSA